MKKEELKQIIKEELNSFKSIKDMSDYLVEKGLDGLDGYGKKQLSIINKHIKSDILDKGKKLTPKSLDSLIAMLEEEYGWYYNNF